MARVQGIFGFALSLHPWSSLNRFIRPTRKVWATLHLNIQTRLSMKRRAVSEHDEQTFRLLLELEQRRSRQSGQAFHLLLCSVSTPDGMPVMMDTAVKTILIPIMVESLRKTDYVGWFVQDKTLGVLLTSLEQGTSTMSGRAAIDRIRLKLYDRLLLHDRSLVLQLYDDLQLPPLEQHQALETTSLTNGRQD